MDGRTLRRTDGQRENSIPPPQHTHTQTHTQTQFAGAYNEEFHFQCVDCLFVAFICILLQLLEIGKKSFLEGSFSWILGFNNFNKKIIFWTFN